MWRWAAAVSALLGLVCVVEMVYAVDANVVSNLLKHGVGFETAKEVFSDQNALVEVDHSSFDEERWRNIGLGGGDVLFVVHTERDDGDIIRIISARRATKNEQDRYFRQAHP